jgi:hypothetical protein
VVNPTAGTLYEILQYKAISGHISILSDYYYQSTKRNRQRRWIDFPEQNHQSPAIFIIFLPVNLVNPVNSAQCLGPCPFPPRLDVGIDPDIFFDDDGRVWYVGTAAPEKPNFPGEGWAPGWKWLVYHGDDLICLSLFLYIYMYIYMYISHMHIYIYHTHINNK